MPRIRMRFLMLLALLTATLPVRGAPPAQTMAPERVKLNVLLLPVLSFCPFFFADAEGYFDEQGLDINFVRFSRGSEAVASLVRGDLDVWAGATSATLLNAIRSAHVQLVADKGRLAPNSCFYTGFLARRDLVESGALDTLSNLKGLRFVQRIPGDHRDYGLSVLLERAGLTREDIEILTLPDAAVAAAFQRGTVDLTCFGEPKLSRVVNQGYAVRWKPEQEFLPDFQLATLAYGERLLRRQPDVGKRFMVAYLKGVRRYNEGKTERNLAIAMKATTLDRAILEQACWPPIREDGRINVESILRFQDWSIQQGYFEEPALSAGAIWNPAFAEAACAILTP